MKVRKKLKSRAGFTLAETLLAVAILMLVSVIVANGLPAAKNAYEKVVLTSNAETMLSTAVSNLRNELGTAWKVQQKTNNKVVSYFSASTGARTELSIDDNKNIKILDYAEATAADALLGSNQNKSSTNARDLVFQGDDSRQGKLMLKADTINLNGNKKNVEITGLRVEGTNGTIVSWPGTLVIDVFPNNMAGS